MAVGDEDQGPDAHEAQPWAMDMQDAVQSLTLCGSLGPSLPVGCTASPPLCRVCSLRRWWDTLATFGMVAALDK